MELSIIVTSQIRPKEFRRLIDSINSQQGFDFHNLQVIFVDQTGGGNRETFDLLNPLIERKYISYHRCGLSEARNQGIPFVNGDIIGFGDDDAWYDPTTLSKIFECFKCESIDGIGCCIENENNKSYANYPIDEKQLTYENHCGVSSAAMFLRYDRSIRFDENIGVGSPYNLMSGEETDYLWTYMEKHPKFKIVFHPEIIVRHPVGNEKTISSDNINKAYKYARGYGYIIHKHPVSLRLRMKAFYRPLFGMILYALKNPRLSKRSFMLLKGRLEGYFFKLPKA